jgi:hypothetical protein
MAAIASSTILKGMRCADNPMFGDTSFFVAQLCMFFSLGYEEVAVWQRNLATGEPLGIVDWHALLGIKK